MALRRALPLTRPIPASSKCWGSNNQGALGLGDTNNRGDEANEMGANLTSVDLNAAWTVVEVAAGNALTCARENGTVRALKTLKCWGDNSRGQLGLGGLNARGSGEGEMGTNLTSVDLGVDRSAVALALGSDHACALLDDATAKCWGDNGKGQRQGPAGPGRHGQPGRRGRGDGRQPAFGATVLCRALPCEVHGGEGRRGVLDVSCGDELCIGEQRADGLHVHGRVQRCVGRGGVLETGDFKSGTGTGQCSTCPSNSESAAASALCQFSAGFTGADGGPCTACEAGGYKATAGSGRCSLCPANSASGAGSDELTDCACDAGYTAPDGGACAA